MLAVDSFLGHILRSYVLLNKIHYFTPPLSLCIFYECGISGSSIPLPLIEQIWPLCKMTSQQSTADKSISPGTTDDRRSSSSSRQQTNTANNSSSSSSSSSASNDNDDQDKVNKSSEAKTESQRKRSRRS